MAQNTNAFDEWIRSVWGVGSTLEVYIPSSNEWCIGEITSKENNSLFDVEYTYNNETKTKSITDVNNSIIRPWSRSVKLYKYIFNAISDCKQDESSHQLKLSSHETCYEEPVELTKSFGEMQSPINIISTTVSGKTKIMKDDEFISNPLTFRYASKLTKCTILNNGHTVQINIPSHNKCELLINNKTYSLKQFHFHTPSEHLIDSKQFEMEMHLVHINQQNEIAVLGFIFTTKQKRFVPQLQYTQSKAHLVLAKESKKSKVNTGSIIMETLESGSDDGLGTDDEWDGDDEKKDKPKNNYGSSKKGNDFLEQFWDELPPTETLKDIPLKNPLSFDYLFETSSNNFRKTVETNEIIIDMEIFEYVGSLTTPPYTENVQWLVSKTTHFINNKQLYTLSGCWGHGNNARPVQKYFGRTVSLRSKSNYDILADK